MAPSRRTLVRNLCLLIPVAIVLLVALFPGCAKKSLPAPSAPGGMVPGGPHLDTEMAMDAAKEAAMLGEGEARAEEPAAGAASTRHAQEPLYLL